MVNNVEELKSISKLIRKDIDFNSSTLLTI